ASSLSTVTNTITVGASKSLTVNGNVVVGGLNHGGNTVANEVTNLTVSGAGALSVTAGAVASPIFIVGNLHSGNTAAGDTINATLDLSGLSSFTLNHGAAGIAGVGAGPAGTGG